VTAAALAHKIDAEGVFGDGRYHGVKGGVVGMKNMGERKNGEMAKNGGGGDRRRGGVDGVASEERGLAAAWRNKTKS